MVRRSNGVWYRWILSFVKIDFFFFLLHVGVPLYPRPPSPLFPEPEAAQQAAKATDVLFKPVLLLHEKAEKEEYDRIAIQIVQKTPDSANMDTTNELNNHFQLFNKNLIATMNRYEVITMVNNIR